jgi:hypothetical protein
MITLLDAERPAHEGPATTEITGQGIDTTTVPPPASTEPCHLVNDRHALALARRHQTAVTALCGHQTTPRTVATVRALIAADNVCPTCRDRWTCGVA